MLNTDPIKIQPPPIKNNLNFGLGLLIVFIAVLLIWSLIFRLDSAALATGQIIADSYTKQIQHLEGGIIKAIKVRDGDEVQAGDLLIELDPTQSQSQVDILSSRYVELTVRVARLTAERDNHETIAKPQIANKYQAYIQQTFQDQVQLFTSRKNAYESNIKILEQRIKQLNDQINSYQSQVTSADMQIELLQEEIKAYKALKKQEYVDKPRMLALQREQARLNGEKGENIGLIASTQQKVGETETQIVNLKNERRKEILEQLNKAQIELKDTVEQLTKAEDIYARTKVYSPVSGTVVGLTTHTLGGVVSPGNTIMQIVPKNDTLVIEARINPIDIDMIHIGLTANVQLTAFKMRNTPSVKGKVKHISADVFNDERDGSVFYKAIVQIDDKELSKLNQDIVLVPGMPVNVAIIVDKRSAMRYLIGPITASFKKAFREQ